MMKTEMNCVRKGGTTITCYFKFKIIFGMFFLFIGIAYAQKKPIKSIHSVHISGYFADLRPGDSVMAYVWTKVIDGGNVMSALTPHKVIGSSNNNGYFKMTISGINELSYFTFLIPNPHPKSKYKYMDVMDFYLIRPGDDIFMNIRPRDITFKGHGWAKYQCRFNIDYMKFPDADPDQTKEITPLPLKDYKGQIWAFDNFLNKYEWSKMRMKAQMDTLNKYAQYLDKEEYDRIRSFSIEGHFIWALGAFSFYVLDELDELDVSSPSDTTISAYNRNVLTQDRSKYLAFYHQIDADYEQIRKQLNPNSSRYIDLIAEKQLRDGFFKYKNSIDPYLSAYQSIKDHYKGDIRDRIVCNFFLEHKFHNKHLDSLALDALGYVKDPMCREIVLSQLISKPGSKAFDFECEDFDGRKHRLSDYLGKVVFVDFYFTGCAGCTEYYESQVSKAEENFKENKKVVFIAISIDKDHEKWGKSIRQEGEDKYTTNKYPNVVNLYTDGLVGLHPVIRYYNIMDYPHPMLIDEKGNIITADENVLRFNSKDALTKAIQKALN